MFYQEKKPNKERKLQHNASWKKTVVYSNHKWSTQCLQWNQQLFSLATNQINENQRIKLANQKSQQFPLLGSG